MDTLAARRASRANRQTANGAGSAVASEQGAQAGDFNEVSATLNFPSIAAGASATLTIAAPSGVTFRASAPVIVTPPPTLEAGLDITGWVTAGGASITVRLKNTTAGAIDPASGTFSALVRK